MTHKKRFISIYGTNQYVGGLEDIFSEVKKGEKVSLTSCYFRGVVQGKETDYRLILGYTPETNLYSASIYVESFTTFISANGNKQELYKVVAETLKKLGFKEKTDIFNVELFGEIEELQESDIKIESNSFNQVDFTDKELYKTLKNCIKDSDTFYTSSQTIDGHTIESFSYRLASWKEFNQDKYKKEMRGLAFITTAEGETKLFTIGFHKFFNYGEGEGERSTVNILLNEQVESIDDKLDGSLILVGKLPDGRIIAKSKTSINSDQAVKATEIINNDVHLQEFINELLDKGLYPIFEYVGPDNRIVLSYPRSELVLTGIRKVTNGLYLSKNSVEKIRQALIPHIKSSKSHYITIDEVLKKQDEDKGYEGFVVSFKNGDRLKIKLKSYVQLHHTKDEVNNVKRIIEMALDENLDDLRTLFVDDQNILTYISRVETEVFKLYNHIVTTVESKYEETKLLDKKSYAIYHQEHNKDIFGLLMQKYISKEVGRSEPDYKKYVIQTINLNHMQIEVPESTES